MKKAGGSFLVLVFLLCIFGMPAFAADQSTEIEQLKQEVNKLLQRIQDLEKKQAETETKAKEAEKKAMEVEKKAGEAESKFAEVEKKTETLGKKFKLDLSAQIRAFYLNRDDDETHDYRNNYFEIYKLRLSAKGELYKLIQFYAMVDANENEDYQAKLWEGGVQFTFLPELVIKIGELRMPFSRHNFTARHQSPVMSSDGDIFLPSQFKEALKAVNPYPGGFRSTDTFKRTDFGTVIAGSINDGMFKYYAALANEDRSASNKVWTLGGGFSSATLEPGESVKDKRGFEYDARIEFTPTMLGFKSEGTVFDPSLRVRQTYLGAMDTMTLGIGYHHELHLNGADESLYGNSSLSRDAWAADFSFEKTFGEYITGLELGYMNFDDTHFYQTTDGYKKGGAWTTYADAHLIYGKKIWLGFPGIGLRYEYVNVDGEYNSVGEIKKDLVYNRYGACLSYWFSDVTRVGIGVDFVHADDALKSFIDDKGWKDSTSVWYLGVYTQI
jgi:hypothetical protein